MYTHVYPHACSHTHTYRVPLSPGSSYTPPCRRLSLDAFSMFVHHLSVVRYSVTIKILLG